MKFNFVRKIIPTLALAYFSMTNALAGGTSSGMTLLKNSGARASSLGGAFSSIQDDITAINFNPSSISTLKSGQGSFLYHKGIEDDAYGQVSLGKPSSKRSWGVTIGYFNGGTAKTFDGTTEKTLTVQRDLSMGFGYGIKRQKIAIGAMGKYLSSELAETYKASAFAGDMGIQFLQNDRLNFGASIQNMGTSLKYLDIENKLPLQARAGFAFRSQLGKLSNLLLMDGVYSINEKNISPAVGVEIGMNPIALRVGYKGQNENKEFSVGLGFIFSSFSLDYSFGMKNSFNTQHLVSLNTKFSVGENSAPVEFASKPEIKNASKERTIKEIGAVQFKEEKGFYTSQPESTSRRVYVIQPGDSLGSIARRLYGRKEMWRKIYQANQHLLKDPSDLEVGQKIILPN